ncbi:MAG: LLM class flavin-dependent oxidoreductase [Chloroflexi bacterium]|nr:LLM class flavin-dependent oxidoreductase [Chloroflexota bacterium]
MPVTFGFVPRRLMCVPSDWSLSRPWDQWMKDQERLMKTAEKAGFRFMGMGGSRMSLLLYASYSQIPSKLRFVNETLTLPMLDPVQVSIESAHVDHMLKGRLDLGVSIGYRPWELQVVGATKRDRVGRFVESLQIIKALWAQETVSFHGKYWNFDDLPLGVKPYQQPHPPIVVSLNSLPAAERAGRMGDGICIGPAVDHQDAMVAADGFRRTYKETNGKEPVYVGARRDFFIGPDPDEAARQAGQKEEYLQFRPDHAYIRGQMSEPTSFKLHVEPVTHKLPGNAFGGKYEHMLGPLARWLEETRITHVTCSFYNCPDTFEECLEYIQGFGEEVIAKINKGN